MWKHLRAIMTLPGMVLVVIPGTILWLAGTDSLGLWQSVPASKVVQKQSQVMAGCARRDHHVVQRRHGVGSLWAGITMLRN